MRIVVALGGNALLERGQKPDAAIQIENVRKAAEALAPLAKEHELVLTHGNGPQVGVLALQSAADVTLSEPYPFDTLGAMTQGMIGYWMLQNLQNVLPGRQVVAMVNQTLVDADDPAFGNPTKFVGTVYSEDEAKRLAAEKGWAVKADGDKWRRVVGSPKPQGLVELDTVKQLVAAGATVICSGGGGVPVVREADGTLRGVEAVIDKDLSASKLAEALDADMLMILTDVAAVQKDFGTDHAEEIHSATPGQLREMNLPAGSMGPKVDAVCGFVEATGKMAAIGRLADAAAILAGTAGTIVKPGCCGKK